MNEETNEHLFGIRLDDTGISFIRKMFRLSGIIFGLTILITLFTCISNISVLLRDNYLQDANGWIFFQFKVMPWVYIAMSIGNFFAGYYYVKFFREIHHSIGDNDAIRFNDSFRHLYRNVVIFMIILISQLIVDLLYLFPMVKRL